MKKKLKALVAMMSVCAVGAVGSAFALTRNQATSTGTGGNFDKAIYLYWGSESSTATLQNCDDLVVGTPQYRFLSVTPKSSKSVAGNVTLEFTLAASDGDYFIDGVSVTVYKTGTLLDDSTVVEGIGGLTPAAVVDKDNLEETTSFAVASGENVHETNAYYAFVIEYDGTNVQNKTLGGEFTISQSFAATPQA